jgi:hypothetical protein
VIVRIFQAPEGDRRSVAVAGYLEAVVNPVLQSLIEAMSLDERSELVEYLESTVESEPIEVTDDQNQWRTAARTGVRNTDDARALTMVALVVNPRRV